MLQVKQGQRESQHDPMTEATKRYQHRQKQKSPTCRVRLKVCQSEAKWQFFFVSFKHSEKVSHCIAVLSAWSLPLLSATQPQTAFMHSAIAYPVSLDYLLACQHPLGKLFSCSLLGEIQVQLAYPCALQLRYQSWTKDEMSAIAKAQKEDDMGSLYDHPKLRGIANQGVVNIKLAFADRLVPGSLWRGPRKHL